MTNDLAALYRRDLTRLLRQIEAFPAQDMLWQTAPGVTNSAGNLVLHLEGNLREYVGRQLGRMAYNRNRPEEFSVKAVPQQELLQRIEELRSLIPTVIRGLTRQILEADFPETILGRPLSSEAMLIHLNGHLNWHLGQIDYLRRMLSGNGAMERVELESRQANDSS